MDAYVDARSNRHEYTCKYLGACVTVLGEDALNR